jgi:small-conductance mechanosensitive channel
VVFLFAVIATFWLRRLAYDYASRWMQRAGWQGHKIFTQATRSPSALWALIISASLALAVASVPSEWKEPVSKGLWTLFLFSLTLCALNLVNRFIQFYGERLQAPQPALILIQNGARVIIIVLAFLLTLEIWGAPTSPILLFVAVAALVAVLAFRDAFPSLLAWFQLSATGQVKVGDYIKLETGEEGYVAEISWRNTLLRALNEGTVLVPNSRLVQSTVINYGRPLKKAKEPFRFHTRVHLKELTGFRAKNLRELADVLKTAPDSVVYYHTHHFLEEHHYLTPEPANDFAIWVSDALGDEVLGERLAAVDTFEFASLGALRERLVSIIEEHLTMEAEHENGHRDAPDGREFHFVKSVSLVLPTPYVAHDLREFVEVLRKVSLGSLYFHVFEARLRLGRDLNDFSTWLEDSLEEKELAERISRFDPYNYTLEGLRSSLIQLIEKRIK